MPIEAPTRPPVEGNLDLHPYQIRIATRPATFPRAPEPLNSCQVRTLQNLRGATSSIIMANHGQGKTDVAIAAAQAALEAPNEIEHVVVLTDPVSPEYWVSEITELTGHRDATVVKGPRGLRWRSYATVPRRWTVIPYSLVATDVEALRPLMQSSLLIIDQAPQVRNSQSARSKATARLSRSAARRLTVLPAPNYYTIDEWHYIVVALALDPRGDNREAAHRVARLVNNMAMPDGFLSITA